MKSEKCQLSGVNIVLGFGFNSYMCSAGLDSRSEEA